MTHAVWKILLLVISVLVGGIDRGWSFEQENVVSPTSSYVHAVLLREHDRLQPGQTHWLMLRLDIARDWHVYWVNPGDSGLPPTIIWSLEEGITVGSLIFPLPQRIAIGEWMNFGYTNQVRLLMPVSLDTDVSVTQSTLKAQVDWLVCKDICIPETTNLEMTLPITEEIPQLVSTNIGEFAQARRLLAHRPAWRSTYRVAADTLSLVITDTSLSQTEIDDISFFPYDATLIEHAAPQTVTYDNTSLTIDMKLKSGHSALRDVTTVDGVLVVTTQSILGSQREGFRLSAHRETKNTLLMQTPTSLDHATRNDALSQMTSMTLWMALVLGVLGGLLLNFMPCVFPILFLKAFSLVTIASQARWQTRLHGMVFTVGVMSTFGVIAGLLIGLKTVGIAVGWGFQLQSPGIVFVLALVFFTIGLLFSGVFSMGSSLIGIGNDLVTRGGLIGTFFTGVLAVFVASPCTVPFMGTAIGFALTQPWLTGIMVFLALGWGMALPYLVLSFIPSFTRLLPSPGSWMVRLKQGLAFPMYGTAAWLVWILVQQRGADGLAMAFTGVLLIAFTVWLFEITRNTSKIRQRLGMISLITSLIMVMVLTRELELNDPYTTTSVSAAGLTSLDYQPYSEAYMTQLIAEGRAVFINFTAAWCITCVINERLVLASTSVSQAMVEKGVVFVKGDWTSYNEEITMALARFGRSGVPLYVLYRPGATPLVLPQLLSQSVILEALATF